MAKRNSRRTSSTTVSVSQAAGSRAAEFNPDYSIVRRDLKRIGVLAGAFTVALIVLSFIIP
ncbi:MAG: hypothetical protein ACM3XO_07935 [Bacteroidota bacterium]|jgi:hypothetical protein